MKVEVDGGRVDLEILGAGGDRPDAGKMSGKNAALGRPAPFWPSTTRPSGIKAN